MADNRIVTIGFLRDFVICNQVAYLQKGGKRVEKNTKLGRAVYWLLVIFVLTPSCARVKFYSDPDLTKETGLKYYTPKPYLLVVRTGAKDKPVDVSVVYLPDLEHPQYAKYKSGWGTHQFTLALANGVMTSYGQTADSKVPETISAVGSLLSNAGGGFKAGAEAYTTLFRKEGAPLLNDAAKKIEDISNDLKKAMENPHLRFTSEQINKGREVQATLQSVAARLKDPTTPPDLEQIRKDLNSVVEALEGLKLTGAQTDTQLQQYNGIIDTLKQELSKTVASLIPSPPAPATVELYEIKQEQGGTKLIPVAGAQK